MAVSLRDGSEFWILSFSAPVLRSGMPFRSVSDCRVASLLAMTRLIGFVGKRADLQIQNFAFYPQARISHAQYFSLARRPNFPAQPCRAFPHFRPVLQAKGRCRSSALIPMQGPEPLRRCGDLCENADWLSVRAWRSHSCRQGSASRCRQIPHGSRCQPDGACCPQSP